MKAKHLLATAVLTGTMFAFTACNGTATKTSAVNTENKMKNEQAVNYKANEEVKHTTVNTAAGNGMVNDMLSEHDTNGASNVNSATDPAGVVSGVNKLSSRSAVRGLSTDNKTVNDGVTANKSTVNNGVTTNKSTVTNGVTTNKNSVNNGVMANKSTANKIVNTTDPRYDNLGVVIKPDVSVDPVWY